jgi:hypothetical protein
MRRPPLVSPENSLWRNALGFLAAAIIIPLALVVKLVTMPFERPVQRTAGEVARYIRDFIDGTGGEWDWDDFECIPIADPVLEAIRERASRVMEPVDADGMATLRSLLEEAEGLAAEEPPAARGH